MDDVREIHQAACMVGRYFRDVALAFLGRPFPTSEGTGIDWDGPDGDDWAEVTS